MSKKGKIYRSGFLRERDQELLLDLCLDKTTHLVNNNLRKEGLNPFVFLNNTVWEMEYIFLEMDFNSISSGIFRYGQIRNKRISSGISKSI